MSLGAPEIEVARRDAWRSLSMEDRIDAVFALSEANFEFARAGIRRRHPEYTDEDVCWAEARDRIGAELFAAAFPTAPQLDP